MRIIAGAWRGRTLATPAGTTTRPTADRARQALFDMLWHAPWAGRAVLQDATVLDAFAGTGALGLEALSRGAARATFFERDRAALAALRTNIAACLAESRCTVLPVDATRPPPGSACKLVFLDPPYAKNLVPESVTSLAAAGWIVDDTLIVAEVRRDEPLILPAELLTERTHGAARISVWRYAGGGS